MAARWLAHDVQAGQFASLLLANLDGLLYSIPAAVVSSNGYHNPRKEAL
jgi:hypothetical protein